jgi:uncharacterized membrane protein YccC
MFGRPTYCHAVGMWRRLASVVVGVIVLAACVVLAIFLHREGIVLAGAWAGIIGLLGIPIGALGVWLAWPRSRDEKDPPALESPIRIQRNTTSSHGSVFAVQDGEQNIYNRHPSDNE